MNSYLKQKLKERNMTQVELAKRCGVGRSQINQIINGTKKPSLQVVYDMSIALDVGIGDLVRSILNV